MTSLHPLLPRAGPFERLRFLSTDRSLSASSTKSYVGPEAEGRPVFAASGTTSA